MKRVIACFIMLLMSISLCSCSKAHNGYEIALITNIETVNDGSFNEGAWNGLMKYAEENKITYKYYPPDIPDKDGYLKAIDMAVEKGAKIIICPGYSFETAIYEAQDKYPDIKFLMLDGQPHNEDNTDNKIGTNVSCIYYSEEQAGFLAGYASVKDGNTKLGFMGGIEVPAVVRYGYGFVQGADYAAEELGVDNIDINYTYTGTFSASPDVEKTAEKFYDSGTEVIFSCGGNIVNSVIIQAELKGRKIIGVDVDQSGLSENVITSAVKKLSNSVYDTLGQYYDNKFQGGKILTLDAADNGVGLSIENSRFNNFNKDNYEEILKLLVNNDVKIQSDKDAESADQLDCKHVTVTVYK